MSQKRKSPRDGQSRGEPDGKSVGDRSVGQGVSGVKNKEDDSSFLEKCRHFFREYDLPLIRSDLSDAELRVFQFLALFDLPDSVNNGGERKGWVTVSRERIGLNTHRSETSVTRILASLERKGYIRRDLYLHKGRRIHSGDHKALKVFILGNTSSSKNRCDDQQLNKPLTKNEQGPSPNLGTPLTKNEQGPSPNLGTKDLDLKIEKIEREVRGGKEQPSAAPSPTDSPVYTEYIRLRREKSGIAMYLPRRDVAAKMRKDLLELHETIHVDDLMRQLNNFFEDYKMEGKGFAWNFFKRDPMEWDAETYEY